MGYRYYATVTFPARARELPQVEEWLEANKFYNIDDWPDTIRVSHAECSDGEIGITEVLDAKRVPYDHYHSDDCSGSPEPETHYVRFNQQGERVKLEIDEECHTKAAFARDLLKLLEFGETEALRKRLDETITAGPPPTMDELAGTWQPDLSAASGDTPRERDRG
jgi:hypothetical protein